MDIVTLEILRAAAKEEEPKAIILARDEVLGRFSPMFQPGAINSLSSESFREFLSFKNNRHWTGLERQPEIYRDMDLLRKSLSVLVNEDKPLNSRMNTVLQVPGMGHGKASAILHVAYPNKYGVWNNSSEKALRQFGWWPATWRGATKGEIYQEVNKSLRTIAAELKVDLWTLDAMWWGVDLSGSISSKTSPRKTAGNAETKNVRSGTDLDFAVASMKYAILDTVKYSNGQQALTTVKNKELLMSETELEILLRDLMAKQGNRCAITGLSFSMRGGDKNFLPSADRINSDGHYEASNIQIVCQFINFWKGAQDDNEFRSLIASVRGSKNDRQ